jgi:hypothetical protein
MTCAVQRRVRVCECGHSEIREGEPFVCPDCGGVVMASGAREPPSEAEVDQLHGQVFARPEGARWMAAMIRAKGVCGVVRLSEIREALGRERRRWGQGGLTPD